MTDTPPGADGAVRAAEGQGVRRAVGGRRRPAIATAMQELGEGAGSRFDPALEDLLESVVDRDGDQIWISAEPAQLARARAFTDQAACSFGFRDDERFAHAEEALPERGRGLAFMAHMVDELDLHPSPEGTVVRLAKRPGEAA